MSHFRVARPVRWAVVLGLLAVVAPAWAASESQTFDDFFSVFAAGWTGSFNTPGAGLGVDFDLRTTNNAGGAAAGEAGGTIPSRTVGFAYYADTVLADNPTEADLITATGRFVVPTIANEPGAVFDGGFDYGFFNSIDMVRQPSGGAVGGVYDFLGLRFVDLTVDGTVPGLRWWPLVGGFAGTWDGAVNLPVSPGVQYIYDLSYDPNGAAAGFGRLTADIRRADTNESLGPITVDRPSTGFPLVLNSFGMYTLDFGQTMPAAEMYIDDLTYANEDAPVLPPANQETQTFDSAAAAAAAGWTGVRNTPGDGFGVDLAHRETSLAGGSAGEAGGVMPTRTAQIAYYADTTLGGSLSEGDLLMASGRITADSLAVAEQGLDGGFELGFFNANDLSYNTTAPGVGGVSEAITIRFLDGGGGHENQLRVNARAGRLEQGSAGYLDIGSDYIFNLLYSPGEGSGSLSINFKDASTDEVVLTAFLSGLPSGDPQMDLNVVRASDSRFQCACAGRDVLHRRPGLHERRRAADAGRRQRRRRRG